MTAVCPPSLPCRPQLRRPGQGPPHDEFRMAHFMYSLPEDIRKDIGWPEHEDHRMTRGR